jgi:hypothetical protein
LVRNLSLEIKLRFCLGFPLDSGDILCSGFLIGGYALRRIGGLAEQLVKPGRLIARLHLGRRGGQQLLLRPGRALRWPVAACYGGLVLTREGAFCGGEVGFELLPPSGHGPRFASGFGLLLSG